jgi:membrane protein DedA with SNARE-associated domain
VGCNTARNRIYQGRRGSIVFDLTHLYWYGFFFLWILATGMGLPCPEEIPVVTAGVMIGTSDAGLRWWIMLPVLIAGVVLGDSFLYGVGRIWGRRLLEWRWVKTRLLPPERRQRIEDNFHRYGVTILLFARFLPAIRSPIFITAGMTRVPLSRFMLADGIYAIPGVSLLFFLGYWFGDQFMRAVQRAESYRLLVVVIVVAVASYLVYHFLNQPMATGDPKEFPVIGTQVAKLTKQSEAATPEHAPIEPASDGVSRNGQPATDQSGTQSAARSN